MKHSEDCLTNSHKYCACAELARLRESNAQQAERINDLEEIVIDCSNQINRIAEKFRAFRRAAEGEK